MARVQTRLKTRRRTFLREWREHNHLTQEQAAERLDMDQSNLSRIERGLVPYDQDFLERAAWAYGCQPEDLIMRNPLDPDAVWSITDNLRRATPEQRATIETVIAALIRKSG